LVTSWTVLEWRDLVEPQIPALVCAAGMLAVVFGSEMFVRQAAPATSRWLILLIQTTLGILYYLAFLRFAPFGDVRSLVAETLAAVSPRLAAWFAPAGPQTKVLGTEG
jgi:hypothetical protein